VRENRRADPAGQVAGSNSTFTHPGLCSANVLDASITDVIGARFVRIFSGSTVPFRTSSTRPGMYLRWLQLPDLIVRFSMIESVPALASAVTAQWRTCEGASPGSQCLSGLAPICSSSCSFS
jgi:hypothetical protein